MKKTDATTAKRPTSGAKTLSEKKAISNKAPKMAPAPLAAGSGKIKTKPGAKPKAAAVLGKTKPGAKPKAPTPAKPKAPAAKAPVSSKAKTATAKPTKAAPASATTTPVVKAPAVIGRPVEIPGKKRVTVDVTKEIVELTLGLSHEKLGLEAGKSKTLSPYFRKAIIAQLELDGCTVKVKC